MWSVGIRPTNRTGLTLVLTPTPLQRSFACQFQVVRCLGCTSSFRYAQVSCFALGEKMMTNIHLHRPDPMLQCTVEKPMHHSDSPRNPNKP
mmetsp:Transcript_6444/g.40281  ORF Transcript_6444/g.40281 Transcript_6444/m.40281 type:complete len:91 (-) Transcript_6444:892-1164(-)